MQYALMIAVGVILITYFYSALQFAIKILDASSFGKVSCFVFAVVNAATLAIMFYSRLAIVYVYPTMFLFLFLQFKLVSQDSWSKALLGSIAFLLNWSSAHLLVFVVFSFVTKIPPSDIYKSDVLLSITLLIAFAILYAVLKALKNVFSVEHLRKVSFFRRYSSIMASILFGMMLYLAFEWWMIFIYDIHLIFMISVLMTICVIIGLFYFLFYFNAHLVELHPYKRKSDAAKKRHSEVLEQKLTTERKIYTDDLTGLYNSRLVNERIEELCSANDISFSIIYGDLIGLKSVNDTYGHSAGDRYIKRMAQVLKSSTRASDICARIGGDEFVVILVDTDIHSAPVVVNKVIKNIIQQKSYENFKMYMTFGYTYVDQAVKNKDAKVVLGQAETNMRNEKASYYEKHGRRELK